MERDTDLAEWLDSVKMLVRYADVLTLDAEEIIAVDVFQAFRQLAVYELFYDITRAVQAEGTGMSVRQIEKALKDERFLQIREMVRTQALALAQHSGMMDTAEALEPQMAEKVLHMALHGRGRDRLKALDEFTGRLSAKKGREDKLIIRMPPDLEDAIARAMETAQRAEAKLLPGGEPDVIDACVVPVPSE